MNIATPREHDKRNVYRHTLFGRDVYRRLRDDLRNRVEVILRKQRPFAYARAIVAQALIYEICKREPAFLAEHAVAEDKAFYRVYAEHRLGYNVRQKESQYECDQKRTERQRGFFNAAQYAEYAEQYDYRKYCYVYPSHKNPPNA